MGPDFEYQSQAREESLPLLKELATLGIAVLDVSDLYNKRLNYRPAIPALLEWLPRIKNRAVRPHFNDEGRQIDNNRLLEWVKSWRSRRLS